jgi:hypothetical protein
MNVVPEPNPATEGWAAVPPPASDPMVIPGSDMPAVA